jgi:DNA-binding MarR family transcriptional regulator
MTDNTSKKIELSEIAAQCVAYNFRKTSRLITSFYRKTIAPSGLKGNQFPLLVALKLRQPISITELASSLELDRTTLSRNLKLLEKHDYIQLKHDNDQRVRNVQLSQAGEEKLALALPLWQQAQDTITKQFGDEQWDTVLESLHEITKIIK